LRRQSAASPATDVRLMADLGRGHMLTKRSFRVKTHAVASASGQRRISKTEPTLSGFMRNHRHTA